MINFELLRDQGILVIAPSGPLESEDFEKLAKEIDPIIASKGKLAGVVISAQAFPGWESFGAFLSHLKFVAGHHRQIERIAVVTDSAFLKIMPRIASVVIHPEIKQFNFAEKDRALAWLQIG